MNAPDLSDQAQSLFELDLDTTAFASDWNHCDQVANYLARMASLDRSDTFLYANLFSTVLNELLEIVFHQHRVGGRLQCTLRRDGATDRIELDIPVSDANWTFYRESVANAQSTTVASLYTKSLLGEQELNRSVGFLELAADYGARIWLKGTPAAADLQLIVDVCLDLPNGAPALS